MSRTALHIEVVRECLRSTRAARTKAMELPAGPERVTALRALGETLDSLHEALARLNEALRMEVRS